MAEREGFEPSVQVSPGQLISSDLILFRQGKPVWKYHVHFHDFRLDLYSLRLARYSGVWVSRGTLFVP